MSDLSNGGCYRQVDVTERAPVTRLHSTSTIGSSEGFLLGQDYCGFQVRSTRTGISFFTGIVSSDGGSILKSVSVAGTVP